MTEDSLALEIARIVDQRVDIVNDRLEATNQRIENLFQTLMNIEMQMDRRDNDLRYDLERQIDGVKNDLNNLEHKVNYG